jgi:hypothetical protein
MHTECKWRFEQSSNHHLEELLQCCGQLRIGVRWYVTPHDSVLHRAMQCQYRYETSAIARCGGGFAVPAS